MLRSRHGVAPIAELQLRGPSLSTNKCSAAATNPHLPCCARSNKGVIFLRARVRDQCMRPDWHSRAQYEWASCNRARGCLRARKDPYAAWSCAPPVRPRLQAQRHERPLPPLTRLDHLVIPRCLAPRNIVGVDVIFLRPPTRTNVLSSSSPVRLTARRRMYTIIKMIVIAVAIGMWIGPRSVVIVFVLGEADLGFDVLTDLNSSKRGSRQQPLPLG